MDKYNRIHHINRSAFKQQGSRAALKDKGSYNGKEVATQNGVSKRHYALKADTYHHATSKGNRQLITLWKELRNDCPDLKKPKARKSRTLACELKTLLSDPSVNLGNLEKALRKLESPDNKIKYFLRIKKLSNYLKKYPDRSPNHLPPIFFEMLAANLETVRLKSHQNIRVVKPVNNRKKKEELNEHHRSIEQKAPVYPKPRPAKLTSFSHNPFFNLWCELIKYDSSLSYPIVMSGESNQDIVKKLLFSDKITAGDLQKALIKIKDQEPWVSSFLDKENLNITFDIYRNRPAYFIAPKIIKHIELQSKKRKKPTGAYPFKAKHDNDDAARFYQKPNIKRKNETPFLLEKAEKKQKNDEPKKPEFKKRLEQIKKDWINNRMQKTSTQPFTKVQVQSIENDQLFTAELINTVPDDVLRSNNWSDDAINALPSRRKTHAMLPEAAIALKHKKAPTIYNEKHGRYFGKGSYGNVKFARITLPGALKPTWCVAKKILIESESEYKKVLAEIRLQNQSGVGVKIHGMANTTNKKGKRQCIIFMEEAKGKDGHSFLKAKHDFMSFSDKIILAGNLLQKTNSMHQRGVYHTDMKWANSTVNNDLSLTVLDFGMGSSDKHSYNPTNYGRGSGYNAPEFITGKKNRLGYMDRAQVDVYNVGVMLGRLFGNTNFMHNTQWDSVTLINAQHHINKELLNIGITQLQIKQLIKRMVDANPDNRPSMQEVLAELNDIKRSEHRKKLEEYRYYPPHNTGRNFRL